MDIVNEILNKEENVDSLRTTSVEKIVEVDKDVGNLLISDYSPFDVENLK